MVTSLFISERITTTDAKAKEARRLAERLITRAKKGFAAHRDGDKAVALAHWRQAARVVHDTDVLRKLFEEIAPHYLERNGGYTRIIRLGTRLGDNAREVLLELVDTDVTLKPKAQGGAAEAEDEKATKEAASKRKAKAKGKASAKEEKAADKKKAKPRTKTKAKAKSKSKAESKTKTKTKAKAKSKSKSKAKG
jgi:large subunit ribosomal protein L17